MKTIAGSRIACSSKLSDLSSVFAWLVQISITFGVKQMEWQMVNYTSYMVLVWAFFFGSASTLALSYQVAPVHFMNVYLFIICCSIAYHFSINKIKSNQDCLHCLLLTVITNLKSVSYYY